MKHVTRKQQPMLFLRLKQNVPGVFSHLNMACTPNWKLLISEDTTFFCLTLRKKIFLQRRFGSPITKQ